MFAFIISTKVTKFTLELLHNYNHLKMTIRLGHEKLRGYTSPTELNWTELQVTCQICRCLSMGWYFLGTAPLFAFKNEGIVGLFFNILVVSKKRLKKFRQTFIFNNVASHLFLVLPRSQIWTDAKYYACRRLYKDPSGITRNVG